MTPNTHSKNVPLQLNPSRCAPWTAVEQLRAGVSAPRWQNRRAAALGADLNSQHCRGNPACICSNIVFPLSKHLFLPTENFKWQILLPVNLISSRSCSVIMLAVFIRFPELCCSPMSSAYAHNLVLAIDLCVACTEFQCYSSAAHT